MCSPTFKPGPPTEKAQVLSDRLNQVLTTSVIIIIFKLLPDLYPKFRSNILPLSSLCIHRGKSVWVLYVDATCINYDGNAFDALLAMVAALKNSTYIIIISDPSSSPYSTSLAYVLLATLPQATFDSEKNVTICSRRAPKLPLQLNPNTPISVSFGIFDSCVIRFFLSYKITTSRHFIIFYRKHVLADPTSFEEPLLDASISVVVGEQGDLISVSQLGSTLVSQSEGSLSQDALPECITSAKRRREILSKQIFK